MLDTETLAAKINRRNELDAEIADLKEQIESAKTKRLQALAIKDAEIADLKEQIESAKTKRLQALVIKDTEIAELNQQIASAKTHA